MVPLGQEGPLNTWVLGILCELCLRLVLATSAFQTAWVPVLYCWRCSWHLPFLLTSMQNWPFMQVKGCVKIYFLFWLYSYIISRRVWIILTQPEIYLLQEMLKIPWCNFLSPEGQLRKYSIFLHSRKFRYDLFGKLYLCTTQAPKMLGFYEIFFHFQNYNFEQSSSMDW